MNEFFSNAANIIREASQSPLGVFSLMILVLAVLGVLFFRRASERTRVTIFVLMFLGVASFGIAISLVKPKEPPAPGSTEPAAPPEASPEKTHPQKTAREVAKPSKTVKEPSASTTSTTASNISARNLPAPAHKFGTVQPPLHSPVYYTAAISPDNSTVILTAPSGEDERHISLGRDRVQKIFTSADKKWGVVIFKVRGLQDFRAFTIDLTTGASQEDDQIAIPELPDAVHFNKKEVVMSFAGREPQRLRLRD